MTTPAPDAFNTIDVIMTENRRFEPPAGFTAAANVRDASIYDRATQDALGFWEGAAERLAWSQGWDTVLDWDPANAHARWFVGGKLNASYNCVDRHITTWRRNKAAIIWEGEPGDTRVLTYYDLYREVNRTAAMLRAQGVRKGDRVAIYMPMVPELAIALLACARIGAPHTVIFGGFSAEALRDRINDSGAKVLLTADGGWRAGKVIPLKAIADAAVPESPTIERVVVLRRLGEAHPVEMTEGRDVWWHEALAATTDRIIPPEPMDSEDPLFILYTSGTTGKPKGQMHTTGGYLVGASLTHEWIFDLKDGDVYWATADIGWITGHSYVVYGPLANGATCVMYEGNPGYPNKDRVWEIVEKYGVTILYTAPTQIRTHMRWGDEYPQGRDLSSLRLLGTVGEPINPEAWMWFYQTIGQERCPIVDTWWQTETGSIMIAPLPGLTATKPGSATRPFPGIVADVVDGAGNSVPTNTGGYLVIRQPWPSMSRTIWGDHERYVRTYWATYPGMYLTGDGARRDEDGYLWLLGRVDDVLNVSGHRIGTMEVESALVSNHAVAEAAVIGIPDEITGQAIVAFVTLRASETPSEAKAQELRDHVATAIGGMARPKRLYFTAELPKTRSAKIMRRLLRDIAEGRVTGDTTTLADPAVLDQIKAQYADSEG